MGAARIYTVTTPYAAADLPLIKYTQSADVMTLTHPSYQDADLSRTGNTAWTLVPNSFGPTLAAPTGVLATVHQNTPSSGYPTTAYTYSYIVTSIDAVTFEESEESIGASCSNYYLDDGSTGNNPISNQVTWNAVAGAEGYAVYKLRNGIYGYIGQTNAPTTSFIDDGIDANVSDTFPTHSDPIASPNYPGVVCYYDQRRIYAMSLNNPETIWTTQVGNFHNMDTSTPAKDTDGITATLVALQANEIRHMIPMNDLIVLTAGAEWRVNGGQTGAPITPSSFAAKPQSYNGSSHVRPVQINAEVLFVQQRGSRVRNLGYAWESDSWVGEDLSILASHLFENRYIVDWALQLEPLKMIWAVMSDGNMLSFTYVKEQDVYAWAQHDLGGIVESCATVAEGDADVLYITINRTVNGVSRRFVERMRPRTFTGPGDAWFLDCALAYSGSPTQAVSGLDHLDGATVNVMGDGNVATPQTVVNGGITLDRPYSSIVVGLPYDAYITTLELDPGQPSIQGRQRRVGQVTVKVDSTRGLSWGPECGPFYEHKDRTVEGWGAPTGLFSGDQILNTAPVWNDNGRLTFQATPGLPATILSIVPKVDVGD